MSEECDDATEAAFTEEEFINPLDGLIQRTETIRRRRSKLRKPLPSLSKRIRSPIKNCGRVLSAWDFAASRRSKTSSRNASERSSTKKAATRTPKS